ncbi:MAG TPA: hypothetical protein V6C81_01280 [Planktothrix sp.]
MQLSEKNALKSVAFGLVILLSAFYLPCILGQKCIFFSDASFWLEPQSRFIGEAYRAGKIPLWNIWSYCGMPQIAVGFPNLYYIPDLLLILLPFSCGLSLAMIFHQTIAAVGMFLLLRRFTLPTISALTGASIYALSGYMFCLPTNHSLVAGAAWIPVCLWSLMRIDTSNRSKFWRFLFATLAIIFLITSARPEATTPGLALIGGYICYSAYEQRKQTGKLFSEVIVWQLRAIFVGFVMTMPALLPMFEWLSVSRRVSGLLTAESLLYSANWYDLLSAVIGPCLGDMRLFSNHYRVLLDSADLPAYVSCAYIGMVPCILSLWGLSDRSWKWRFPLLALFAVSIVACLGKNTPVVPQVLQFFPTLGFVRFPVKLLFFPIFCISVCAAYGMRTLLEAKVPLKATFITLALITLSALSITHGFPLIHFPNETLLPNTVAKAYGLIGAATLFALLPAVLLAAIAVARIKMPAHSRLLSCGALVVLLVCLCSYAFRYERLWAESDFYQQKSVIGSLIQSACGSAPAPELRRTLGLCLERITVPPALLGNDVKSATIATYQYHRQLCKPAANMDAMVPDIFGFEGPMNGDYYHCILHAYFSSSQAVRPEITTVSDWPLARLCALMADNFVVTQRYRRIGRNIDVPLMDKNLFALKVDDEKMNVRLYNVVEHMPRTYITHSWRWADSHNQVLDAIMDPAAPGWVPWSFAYIERAGNDDPQEPPRNTGSAQVESASIVKNNPEEVVVTAHANAPGMLILADQNYQGWNAEIDGGKAVTYHANGFTRAVYIAAGTHTVKFIYRPGSLYLGLVLAGLGLMLVIYLGAISYHRKHDSAVDNADK